jgi:protein phosphatase PTC7
MSSIGCMYKAAIRKSCFVALVFHRALSTTTTTTTTRKSSLTLITKVISKPDLEKEKGEDSYFTLPHSVGVFDGVGGWRSDGIDVSIFSQTLADASQEYIKNAYSPNDEQHIDLRMALTYAKEVIREKDLTGSSTACMLSLNSKTREANVLNLGDSSMMVLRYDVKREHPIHFMMPFQVLDFNTPAQIGHISKALSKKYEGSQWNSPDDADSEIIDIEPNDVILLATDGLWDNVALDDITSVMERHFNPLILKDLSQKSVFETEGTLFRAVSDLVSVTLSNSLDKEKPSPFSHGYNENLRKRFVEKYNDYLKEQPDREQLIEDWLSKRMYKGGKPDDITISLSLVREV